MIPEDWYTKRIGETTKKEFDHRSQYEKDGCKIIHSYPFRRLQGKIQVVSGNESDFHRNRLTHSIEVASIAKSIYRNNNEKITKYRKYKKQHHKKYDNNDIEEFFEKQNKSDIESLLFTIGLIHDIGHPPFGHGGECALNYKMYKYGGFESNAQTLRLVTKVSRFNLTHRTLLGILKYPVKYSDLVNNNQYEAITHQNCMQYEKYLIKREIWCPPKCYYDSDEDIVNKLLKNLHCRDKEKFTSKTSKKSKNKHDHSNYKTFDCSIMDIADDISYSIHDLEDTIFFNIINKEDLENFFYKQKFLSESDWKTYPSDLLSSDLDKRKAVISLLVHKAITGTKISRRNIFLDPILEYYVEFENEYLKDFIEKLKLLVRKKLIETQNVKSIIHGGIVVIMQLFDAFVVNPDLLPEDQYKKFKKLGVTEQMRLISDHISGMTEQYLFKMHQRIFGSNNQNMFDVI